MPSWNPRRKIRILPIVLVVLLCVIGLFAVRLALYRAAEQMLDRWETAGLPGSRPEGRGPALSAVWPPALRWEDVVWHEEAGTAQCRRLEIAIDPQSVLRRSLRITRIRIDDLRIGTTPLLPSWIDSVIPTLPHSSNWSDDSDRPHPDAIWFECEGLRVASIQKELNRIEGWGWTQHPGRWRAIADATIDSDKGLRLRIEGTGIAGDEEVILDANLAGQRNFRCVWQRPLDEPPRWRLTGRDDGSLLPAMLPLPVDVGSAGLAGIIDFDISGEPGMTYSAELQIHELSIPQVGAPPWNVSGCLSIGRGVVSVEELLLLRGSDRLVVSGELPLESSAGSGNWGLTGELDGTPLRAEGVLERRSDVWSLRTDRLDWRGVRTGAIELRTSGDGWGRSGRPFDLRVAGLPLAWLESWLPFVLPGHWTGSVDGQAVFHRAATGWSAAGRAELHKVRITGLPLVEEVSALLGERQIDRAVRLESLRMRWALDSGQLVADSLQFGGRTARVSGLLLAVPPDSVFGLLRVTPSGDELVGAVLRLLGGDEAAIDLGISGSASSPELVPLDTNARRRWRDEVRRIRNRFWR